MENKIQIFENAEFGKVRTVDVNGVPYFIGKDVCEMFGDKNHNRSLGRIDSEDKTKIDVIDSLGRKQSIIAVNESGLYALLFTMQPQKANNDGVSDAYPIEVQERIEKLHKFKRWVTAEILPSIRKTGNYSVTVPKTYGKKSTSAGEVASLIKVLRSIMKDQKSDPAKIAEMAERICKQFGIDILEELPEKNPFENQMFLIGFMHK